MKRLIFTLALLCPLASAQTTLSDGFWRPDPLNGFATAAQFVAASTLTASTHFAAAVLQVPKAGVSIHKVCYRTGTVSVNAASRLTVMIETVSTANGDPTGSAYGSAVAGTHGSAPASNTWYCTTLGTDATVVNAGDIIAATIKIGTFNASDSVVISGVNSATGSSFNFPYVDTFTASWSKSTTNMTTIALEYSDGTYAYIPSTAPWTTIANQSYASNTAGTDEYALSFQMPFTTRLKCVAGSIAGAGDYEIIFYTGTTATQTITVDKDQHSGSAQRFETFCFTTPPTVTANTTYRVGIRPTTTTSITLQIVTFNSNATMAQVGGGTGFTLGTRLNQGAWDADTTTQRPQIFLLFDQFTTSSGGNGASASVN